MGPNDDSNFSLSDPSDIARVVCGARQILAKMGFDQAGQYLIAAAVSELATNIIRYANMGSISMREEMQGDERTFVVTARDFGPGIHDVAKALEEHYSTGKGLGLGLPSVKRIMDEFEIQSTPGKGTSITAKKRIFNRCGQ